MAKLSLRRGLGLTAPGFQPQRVSTLQLSAALLIPVSLTEKRDRSMVPSKVVMRSRRLLEEATQRKAHQSKQVSMNVYLSQRAIEQPAGAPLPVQKRLSSKLISWFAI
jgi:hypothetical protein